MKSEQDIPGTHLTENQQIVLNLIKTAEQLQGMVIAESIDYQAAGFSYSSFMIIISKLVKKGLIKPWRHSHVRAIVICKLSQD